MGRVMFFFDNVGINVGLFCLNFGDWIFILILGDFLLLVLGFLGIGGGGFFLGRVFKFRFSLFFDLW